MAIYALLKPHMGKKQLGTGLFPPAVAHLGQVFRGTAISKLQGGQPCLGM